MSTYLELEIQNLLNEEQDLSQICDLLIKNIETNPDRFTLDNINSLARFFINSHRPGKLIQFVLKHIDNESFPIPWPYFLEALGAISGDLDDQILNALTEGIEESNAENESARSSALDDLMPVLGEWRSNRKYKIHKDYINNKRFLLDQLITLRTQQLYENEKSLLARLQKLYPDDIDIRREVNEHKQRYALEVLQRRAPRSRAARKEDFTSKDPEVETAKKALLESLIEQATKNPDLAFDFAIVAFILEGYEDALHLLSVTDETIPVLWLRLEILLQCRRFVELLNDLAKVELLFAHDPETFFATAYLRAQAMWGLGQKHTAIEIIEGLLASRPHYRAASALLSIWRGV